MISISDETFAKMQTLATPLVDTPDTLIDRALGALAEKENPTNRQSESSVRSFNPGAPPSLAHTTPNAMTLCGTRFAKAETSWNHLMVATIREAARRGKSPQELHLMLTVNSVLGRKQDSGYKFLPDVGISVQGQDANGAWRQTYEIASMMNLGVEVEFSWQNKPKAAMPNVRGRFIVGSAP
jgi:hypothetical protein